MNIIVVLEDGTDVEFDASKVVIQTLTPVKLAANSPYEIVIMDEKVA